MKRYRVNFIISLIALAAILGACLTLAACDKKNTHTVSFYNDTQLIDSVTVKDGANVLQPQDPTAPTGFVFDFWSEEGSDDEFDFNTPIKDDLKLYAHFKPAEEILEPGDGSAEHPYALYSADDIVELAANVAAQDDDDFADYATAYYALGADIDMSGVEDFYGIGRALDKPFRGSLDGRGHAIKNLTIEASMGDAKYEYVGLFGVTNSAVIKNLKITNIDYALDCRSDVVAPYAGGAVGRAILTNFKNVQVDGTITTYCNAQNSASIGGLIGEWSSDTSYGEIVNLYCAENCYAAVEVKIGQGFSPTVLEDLTYVGGLIGNIGGAAGSGIHSVINCSTAGRINGGQYVGGIAGIINGNSTSIINCFSSTYVKASATSYSYAGGIVGQISGNSAIVDCLSTGDVFGKMNQITSEDISYCGGVVGFMYYDEYDEYYDPGAVILNAYYTGELTTNQAQVLAQDTSYQLDEDNIQAFLTDRLDWDARCWDFSQLGDGIAKPTAVTAADLQQSYSVKLVKGEEVWRIKNVSTQNGYQMIQLLDSPNAEGNNRFFDWMHYDRVSGNATNMRYYLFIPVIKEITLVAKMVDVTPILGTYTCVQTISGESKNEGSIAIRQNGMYVRYYNSGAEAPAPYLFDGKHIILRSQDDVEDLYVCVFDFNKKQFSYRTSSNLGDATCVFTWKELPFNGEFYSENGDIIIFSSENGFCMSTADLVNDNGFEDFVIGNYTVDSTKTVAQLSGGRVADAFDSMTFTRNQDGSITVNAVGKSGHANLTNVVFRTYETVEYYDEPFIGQYECVFVTSNRQDTYTLSLGNDGFARYEHADTVLGYYHFFNNTVLLELSGKISRLDYIANDDVLFGFVNRGTSDRARCVFPRSNKGFVKAFLIDGSTENILFVNDTDVYFVKEGKYVENFVFDDAEKLRSLQVGDAIVVTLDGKKYVAENAANQYYPHHYIMTYYGNEADEYVYEDKHITLDGIGGVRANGVPCGKYVIYDTLVFVMFYDNSLLGFDYMDAKLAQNVITPKQNDSLQGAWITDEINVNGYVQVQKLLIDGFGHATIMYKFPDEASSDYRFYWDGWGTYYCTATGAVATVDAFVFNITFYHNKQMAYLRSHNDAIDKLTFFVNGYTGSKEVPTPPANIFGKYVGTDSQSQQVILNLDRSLNGTLRGFPFNAFFDGDHTVYFYIDGDTYGFDFQALILSYGDEHVELTSVGVITDIIPASFCGTWTGDLVSNDATATAVTIDIDNTGKLAYCGGAAVSVTYDANHMIITVTVRTDFDSLDLTLMWNSGDGTFFIKVLYESGRFMSGTLTKSVS